MADLLILSIVVLQVPVKSRSGPRVRRQRGIQPSAAAQCAKAGKHRHSRTWDPSKANLLLPHRQDLISQQQSRLLSVNRQPQPSLDRLWSLKEAGLFSRGESSYLYLQLSSFSINLFSCFMSRQGCLDSQDKPLNTAAKTGGKTCTWS